MMLRTRLLVLATLALTLGAPCLSAQRGGRGGGGRGGGGMSRGGARTSVSRPPSRPSGGMGNRPAQLPSRPSSGVGNRPANPISSPGAGNRPGNAGNPGGLRPGNAGNINRGDIGSGNRGDVNVNRPINVGDVDPGYSYNRGWGGCCYRPIAGAVVAGAAIATAAAIGSVVYSLPPSCSSLYYNSYTYLDCGGTWYQPQFEGEETTYIVVEAPPGASTTPPTPPATPPTTPPTTPPATPPTTPPTTP